MSRRLPTYTDERPMTLLNGMPAAAPSLESADELLAIGLVGSHRHFLRTWSSCLTASRVPTEPSSPFRSGSYSLDDAYSIAGRCLATWSGQPWTADLLERPVVPSHYSRAFILPPTAIAHPADVTAAVEALLAERRDRPAFWRNGRAAVLYALCTLVSEMGENICEHSRSIGCVAVCWHEGEAASAPWVSVGIVDAGIGFRTSIAERLREAGQPSDLTDAEAIARALELPYPVVANGRQRGTGLRMSRDLIQRYQGVLHIRSGSAVVSMGPSAQFLVGRCAAQHAPVPGAQICAYLKPP